MKNIDFKQKKSGQVMQKKCFESFCQIFFNFIKKDALAQVFSFEFSEIFKNTFF